MKRFAVWALLAWALFIPAGATAATVETYRTVLSDNKILMDLYVSTVASSLHYATRKRPFFCPPKGKKVTASTIRSITSTIRSIIDAVLKNDRKEKKLDPKTPLEAIVIDVLSKNSPCKE